MSYEQTVFTQVMDHLPLNDFRKCVSQYRGNFKIRSFTCLEQFLCMAFAQVLIATARPLYAHDDFGVDLESTVYALDASTIDLCLSLFPWARFRETKGAIKLHTLMNLRGNIPEFIYISDGKLHDVKVLDILIPEAGSFYVMDRDYLDYARLYSLHQNAALFVTRAKSNFAFRRLYSQPVDKSTGLRSDQTVVLINFYAKKNYPDKLRRIVFRDLGKISLFMDRHLGIIFT